jgi:hypothetical protein
MECIVLVASQRLWEGGLRVAVIVVSSFRATLMLALCIAHGVLRPKSYSRKTNDLEQESLIATAQVDYGTNVKSSTNTSTTPQKRGGWLDYFIGFRILFPYLW